ncbi:WD40-repeat-containing domain protein [Tribonema minus]|uniref:WD40-repeat-containing domain protein n=1 Tax=Tribonema minus TaxID=303371 RepID=A0A835YP21_9STRA|nr:WD40-repeat-containing domain protein [Tribonema minus]
METSAGVVAELDLGCPLTSLCLSPNLQYCAVGARDVVKVLDLGPEGFAEVKTLSITTKGSIKFSITDVSWSAMDSGLVAAAMNNGGIVVWDVLPSHHSERVMVEHQRTVNRVAWHPSEPALLLSCSMDNSIKLWDRRGRTHHCAVTFRPRSEAVRDVQFSPFQPHRFAAAFENGQLQVWDRRKVSQPQLKIMAHSQPIMAIDWHPMRDWVIATGSRDRTVR